jgi:hypothetical protein
MKVTVGTLLLLGVAFAFAAAVQNAEAAQKVRKNETWCLETAMGAGHGGGGTMNLCNFETQAQCIASKVTQGDRCNINPILAFERWNREHGRY